ncbi:hypothetical protein PRUPE_7G039500 [Prunus persica]|uniref:Uncharacterized protein n=1 Tax=Prunus persica TaxID=3760 RepID=A0A251N9I5_PRUPE|nr:hypothetical protein PRUPE_7G039500 [Prunus persica]
MVEVVRHLHRTDELLDFQRSGMIWPEQWSSNNFCNIFNQHMVGTNSWVSAEIILVDNRGLVEIILALLSGRNILSQSIHEE